MASSYETIQYGSTGDAVRQLQELLKKQGYDIVVDGSFGSQTQKAVRDYQSRNALTVDGVVGSQTWGNLTGGDSGVLESARKHLQDVTDARPGAYESPYGQELKDLYDQIMTRPGFSYDPGKDPMYGAYRDQYRNQGRLAMEDTMGRAAGLTGGYGSSYSQAVGQQTYNGYLTQFTDRAQDLYRLALERYNSQSQDLMDRYGLLKALEDRNYSRYQDDYDRWWEEYDTAQDRYDKQRELEYQHYQDMLAYWKSVNQSGSSGGSSRRSSGSGSGASGEQEEDALDYGTIKALARKYLESGGSDPLGSDAMTRWMAENGITGKSAELFLQALEMLGYGTEDSGKPGGGRGGNPRKDRVEMLN